MKDTQSTSGADNVADMTDAAGAEPAYLELVGERVRQARLRRGMTRGMLSRDSGVSERFLAQLESGRGNISIQRLRDVARAMDVPIAELVRDGVDPPVELSLIVEHLQSLDGDGLEEARELLVQRFRRQRSPARRVALIGLRGAGKSTLGRSLASQLRVPFVRLVDEIEREAGMEVGEILALSGFRRYRRLQRRALDRVMDQYDAAVIEVAGGLVTEPAMFNSLLAGAWTIWLRASPEEHMSRVIEQGDLRPMAGNEEAMEDLRRILAARDPFYQRADAVLDTSGRAVAECLDELTGVCDRLLESGSR